jgi:hypothetical protein
LLPKRQAKKIIFFSGSGTFWNVSEKNDNAGMSKDKIKIRRKLTFQLKKNA